MTTRGGVVAVMLTLVTVLVGSARLVRAAELSPEPDAALRKALIELAKISPPEQEWITVGDIMIKRTMAEKGAFLGNSWPGGVVPVCFASVTATQRSSILASIQPWTVGTGVKFVEDCELTDRINIVLDSPDLAANACGSSALGRVGLEQPLRLRSNLLVSDPGCTQHEMGHALGLIHEHQRADRDSFVEILTQNICAESAAQVEVNFGKLGSANSLGLPYDFDSIMHYGTNALGCVVAGVRQQTIRARATIGCGSPASSANCDALMGRRSPPSAGDMQAVTLRYPPTAPYCHAKFVPSIFSESGSPTVFWQSGNGQLELPTANGPAFLPASGSQLISPPLGPGFYGFDFTVRGAGGATSTCSPRVTVHAAVPPSCSATYSPSTISPGGASVLSWTSSGGQFEVLSFSPNSITSPSGSTTIRNLGPGTYPTAFRVRSSTGQTATCSTTLTVTGGTTVVDEPGISRFTLPTPNPANASCPAGFFIAVVDDGAGSGVTPGAFGMELLLDDPGTRVLAGGLNFGGLFDVAQVGFAGFTIANPNNELQRLNLALTGSPSSNSSAFISVRIRIARRTATTSEPVFDTTQSISLAVPFTASVDLPPAFYEATVAPVSGTAGGAPEGQFYFSLTTSFVNRPGGGFQGGAVVGGYHATHPFGGVSGFAAFCLATPHSTSVRVLSQPSYGPAGARDLRLRIQDAQQRDIVVVPSN